MSFSNLNTRTTPVAGNGVTTAFSVTFPFNLSTDLKVYKRVTATGAETLQTEITDYTVTGGSGSTGTVTFVTAPASTEQVIILRDPPLTQLVDLVENDNSPAETIEASFDKLTQIAQRLKDGIERSVRLPETETGTVYLPNSVDRVSKYLAFDSSGSPIAADLPVGDTVVSAFMATVLDDTTAAAARSTLGFNGAGGVVATGDLAADAATNAKLANMATQTIKGRNTAGTGDPEDLTPAQVRSIIGVAPTVQKFTSGSGTYTRPSNPTPLYIRVRMVGGGGGGAGCSSGAADASAGSAGNDTTFGTAFLTAAGGSGGNPGGSASASNSGGTISAGTGLIVPGQPGIPGVALGASGISTFLAGGSAGGHSMLGAGAPGGSTNNAAGIAAAANTGGGGSGASVPNANSSRGGGGGGGGGGIDILIASPSSTYAYAVGAGGNGGAAGTGGSAGGNGGSGVIIVEEFYC